MSVGNRLRVSCCVIVLPPGDLPREATSRISASTMREMLKPECSKKPRVFRGEDRLAQVRRNVVVVDDHAALDRELADELAVLAEHARDGVRRVVVERADFGQVVGIGEQHAAQRAEQGSGRQTARRCRRDERNERRLSCDEACQP